MELTVVKILTFAWWKRILSPLISSIPSLLNLLARMNTTVLCHLTKLMFGVIYHVRSAQNKQHGEHDYVTFPSLTWFPYTTHEDEILLSNQGFQG